MFIKEVAASLYPWDLADQTAEVCVDNLVEHSNVNSVYLVGVMHEEKRPLTSLFYTLDPIRKYYLPENSRVYSATKKYPQLSQRPGTSMHRPQTLSLPFSITTHWRQGVGKVFSIR